MKALVYTGPQTLSYQETPEPTRQPDDIVVKIDAVGVCGSDMHAYLGHDDRRPAPLILGHEAMGIVEEGGLAGKRVVINPLVTCGVCDVCTSGHSNICAKRQIISMDPRQGAFAEKVAIPERNLVAVPDHLTAAQAALAEPLATGWHAIVKAVQMSRLPIEGCRVLVIGGGAIGMSAALSLRAKGCSDIFVAETNPLRRDAVTRAEVAQVFNPIEEPGMGENGADVVVDCVGGGKTRALASAAVRPGGTIVHVGLQDSADGLDVRKLTLQEISFSGVYTYTMRDFEETVAAMGSGDLGPLDWFEERRLADGGGAFKDLLEGRVAASKIILRPGA